MKQQNSKQENKRKSRAHMMSQFCLSHSFHCPFCRPHRFSILLRKYRGPVGQDLQPLCFPTSASISSWQICYRTTTTRPFRIHVNEDPTLSNRLNFCKCIEFGFASHGRDSGSIQTVRTRPSLPQPQGLEPGGQSAPTLPWASSPACSSDYPRTVI